MEDTSLLSPTPAATSKKNGDKKQLILVLVIVLLLAALGAVGYLYWQLKQTQQQLSKKESEKTALQQKLEECQDDTGDATPVEEGEGTDDLPVVIFSPGGVFTDAEKTEITNKMINPYKAWHLDQDDSLASIHVQQDIHVPGQYVVDVIYQGGVYEGFLYGTIDAATQDWWFPECLDACEFTAEFRAAYPEVVAAAGS